MTAVGDPLRRPAAEQRHEERAERDEDRHAPLHSRSDGRGAPHEAAGQDLIVGVGARSGARAEDVLALIARTLREARLPPGRVVELATVASAALRPAIAGAGARLGVPVRGWPPELLAGVAVPNPSAAPLAATGTASVAEAAALMGGGVLLVPKRKSVAGAGRSAVTCAVASRGHSEWNRTGRT
ncbi:cobalamin biosynthesis protein [Streptomyces corynorhini]|uniref:Cobyrinic acid a,c-diamide synthase n=1 Tax=Streptomyces corynorhini TaxID=2282652 RepID=A0A370B7F2_9ACTN|nr:cobalamin biosynthesis protein [Streptomyces corynorhini]RDG36054.1 cobyrinic acid a,c-diamide synthase [Streptomyces corynorhini]